MPDVAAILKERRELLGLTLKEVAKLAGFRYLQTLHKIENGARAIKVDELSALARVYSLDINLLLLGEKATSDYEVFWRADPNPPLDRSCEQKFRLYFDRYIHLEKILGKTKAETGFPHFEFERMNLKTAGVLGGKYSELLKLGDRPALSLASILEKEYNTPIFFLSLPNDSSAISLISNGRSAICVNQTEAPWRRSFDIAHELFHIIYKKSISEECGTTDTTLYEKLANAFASALLLPKDSLEREINQRADKNTPFTISILVVVARDLGVSLAALIWRLVNLGYMKRSIAKKILLSDAVKNIDKEARKNESWSIPHISQQYLYMVFEAVNQSLMSKIRGAEYIDVSVGLLEEIFSKAGLVLEEDLIEEEPEFEINLRC